MTRGPDLLAPPRTPAAPRPAHPAAPVRIDRLGGPDALVLSGPPAGAGTEPLPAHRDRWGPLPGHDGAAVRALLRDSHVDGRGGGGFPVIRKIETALLAPGRPVLIVNASESEPASAKDRTLCRHRPHLVLDGAALLARALGADEVVVHAHRGAATVAGPLARAVVDRVRSGVDDPVWRLSEGPDRYVSGEASAVAAFVAGGEGRPRFTTAPLAVVGPTGRPTVVSNAETVAQVAVAARIGSVAWNALGAPSSPGPRLVTLAGAVPEPGLVLELDRAGDDRRPAGRRRLRRAPGRRPRRRLRRDVAPGDEAWQTPFSREALHLLGAAPGCGLLGVLPHDACPLREAARIVRYLAGESAGQCGTCVAGLPRLAEGLEALAGGSARRRNVRRLASLADTVVGSGACAHPDGVVLLVRSTLAVFEDDVVRHLAGGPCRGRGPAGPSSPCLRAGRCRPATVRRGTERLRAHRPDPLPGPRHLCALLRRRRGTRPVGLRPGGGRRRGRPTPAPPGPPCGGGLPQRCVRGDRTVHADPSVRRRRLRRTPDGRAMVDRPRAGPDPLSRRTARLTGDGGPAPSPVRRPGHSESAAHHHRLRPEELPWDDWWASSPAAS